MKQARRNNRKNTAHPVHSRKIDRAVARYAAKRAGLARLTDHRRNRYKTKKNKFHGRTVKNEHYSAFSQRWREIVQKVA